MAKLRLDNLKMDRQAQAKGEAALYEVRNTDPEENQGFKRRHGSKIATDGATVNATGLSARGTQSYLRVDDTFDASGNFSVCMSVKLGDLSDTVTATYHTLFAVRDGATVDVSSTELPTSSYVCFIEQTAAVIKIGFGETDAAGALITGGTDKTAITGDLSASAGDSFFVTATKQAGAYLSIRCHEVADTGFLVAGSDVDDNAAVAPTNLGANTILEFLGSEVQGKKGSGPEPVIQNILVYNASKATTTITDLTGATTTAKATRASHNTTNLVYHYRLDSGDTYSDAAIADLATAGDEPYLHLHPSPPAVLTNALQFGGSSGAFEVPFSSEFLSLFETKVRNVVNDDWSIYIKTTLGPTIGIDHEKTLCQFGQLFRLYIKTDNKVYAEVNASGTTAGTELKSTALTVGTEYEIVLRRSSDGNAYLYWNGSGGTSDATKPIPQDTFLDLRRLYNVILGGQEDQKAESYYSGSVTKFAFYPFAVTSDAGKDGALFYYDFTEGKYEDQANSLTSRRVFHHASTQKPAYTIGGNGFQDGKFIGVGGGVAFPYFFSHSSQNLLS